MSLCGVKCHRFCGRHQENHVTPNQSDDFFQNLAIFYHYQTLQRQEFFSLDYTFFRGSKEQMMGRKMPEPSETTVTVTVVQEGMPDIKLQCPGEFCSSSQNRL